MLFCQYESGAGRVEDLSAAARGKTRRDHKGMNGQIFREIRESAGADRKTFATILGVRSVAAWEDGLCLPVRETMVKVVAFAGLVKVDCTELKDEWNKRMSNLETIESINNPFESIRRQTGLSQKEFAKLLGVKTVANWESGKCFPNFRSMKKIVAFCTECDIDYTEAQTKWKERNRNSNINKCAAQRRRWEREKNVQLSVQELSDEEEVKKESGNLLTGGADAVKSTVKTEAPSSIELQTSEKPAKEVRHAAKRKTKKAAGGRQKKRKQGGAAKKENGNPRVRRTAGVKHAAKDIELQTREKPAKGARRAAKRKTGDAAGGQQKERKHRRTAKTG